MTRRTIALLVSFVLLVAAACASPTAPNTKGCDVVTSGGGTC
ncbi:MAG TPA: hypothetical protein VJL28_03720 [Gemmatimonadaceae bacterium]|nr:hypothetical protein [Gemmatimonadaceae bacterium]